MHILRYISCLTQISFHNEPCDIVEMNKQKFDTSVVDGILEQYVYVTVCLHSYQPELNAI